MHSIFVVTRVVVGLFLKAGGLCLSESSSELGLLEKIAGPLLALTLWELLIMSWAFKATIFYPSEDNNRVALIRPLYYLL